MGVSDHLNLQVFFGGNLSDFPISRENFLNLFDL